MFNLELAITEWRRQMLNAGIKTPVPLDELESHLREDIAKRMQSEISAELAFEGATQQMGAANILKGEFDISGRTKTGWINHNRIYSAILAILTVNAAFTTIGLYTWQHQVGGPVGHLPEWSLPWVTALHLAYGVAMFATLIMRRYRPESGRRLTRLLNWALLPAIPAGPIVGIYGLWKVDRAREQFA